MITIRTATDADWPAIKLLVSIAFGSPTPDTVIDRIRAVTETAFVAVDGDVVVGSTITMPLTMTVPGGKQVPVAGVSWVTVAPTHRRRGILRAMFTEQHRTFDAPFAALTASEGGIYGRFGYGPATMVRDIRVDRRRAVVHPSVPDPGGVRMATAAQARAAAPAIYDRWQRRTPGAQAMPAAIWDRTFAGDDDPGKPDDKLLCLLHPDGFVLYHSNWTDDGSIAEIRKFCACTDDAYVALWRTLLGLDLTRLIKTTVAEGDPLGLLLTDHRLVAVDDAYDKLWLRPMHVPAALESRTYAADLDTVLQVHDEFLDAGGTFALTITAGQAKCVPTDEPAVVTTDLDTIGMLFLGAHKATALARANRLQTKDFDVLHAIDAAFATDSPAELGYGF